LAKYRQVHVEFWQDGFVLDLTPEEKYFYIYLMTNSKTSQCGIYELPKRIIETETGYNRETVDKLLNRFIDYGKIHYDESTKEIMLLNWIKYNSIKSPKTIACIKKELTGVKNKGYLYAFDTLCKGYGYPIDTPYIYLGEEEEQEEEEEEEREKEEEREREQQEEKAVNVFDFFQQNFGVLSPYIGEEIGHWIDTLNEVLVLEAMKKALLNQKPWSYAIGILKDWEKRNIRTLADVQASDLAYERQKQKRTGVANKKATRTEILPGWFNEPDSETQEEQLTPEALAKQKALEDKLKKFKKEPNQ
jgi:DnaD/phage-associated family protein